MDCRRRRAGFTLVEVLVAAGLLLAVAALLLQAVRLRGPTWDQAALRPTEVRALARLAWSGDRWESWWSRLAAGHGIPVFVAVGEAGFQQAATEAALQLAAPNAEERYELILMLDPDPTLAGDGVLWCGLQVQARRLGTAPGATEGAFTTLPMVIFRSGIW